MSFGAVVRIVPLFFSKALFGVINLLSEEQLRTKARVGTRDLIHKIIKWLTRQKQLKSLNNKHKNGIRLSDAKRKHRIFTLAAVARDGFARF